MTYITLNQNYGYTPYKITNLAASSVIDATKATWIVDNSSIDYPDATHSTTSGTGAINTYPFKVDGAGLGLLIKGGTILGQVPQQSDWQYTYNNSAAIRVANAPGVIIDDWRLDGTWDAIRIAAGSTNFLIDDTWITNVRDDAVENDYVLGGTIRDSLFDGVFSGISLGDSDHYDGSMNTLTLDGLMMRNKSYLFEGKVTHETPFKCDTGAPGTTPDIRIDNSVIAIEDVNHAGQKRLQIAWDHVVESHGNVFLNLSDTPLPSTYPRPPAGFTILQGQQARDYWEACKAAWHANHDGVNDSGVTALPPLPGAGTPTPPPPAPPPGPTGDTHDVYNDFNGDGRSDLLWHNNDGTTTAWLGTANGGMTDNSANFFANAGDGWHIIATGDFNGDRRSDILWQKTDGTTTDWLGTTSGGMIDNSAHFFANAGAGWQAVSTGDFNGDGRDDILWQKADGTTTDWLGTASGGMSDNSANFFANAGAGWQVIATADFNGDGRDDILWQKADGTTSNWLGTAKGGMADNSANFFANAGAGWQILATGDFNGDGRDDILWQSSDGTTTNWLGTPTGGMTDNSANFFVNAGASWRIVGTGDFNGDNRDDILWQTTDGTTTNWLGTVSGGMIDNSAHFFANAGAGWHLQDSLL